MKTTEDRFWEKVSPSVGVGPCWRWNSTTNWRGYGQFWVGGRGGFYTGAHRWAYESLIIDIPDGLQLDHLCRVRCCVNPWHLEPVTQRVNLMRGAGITATNARKTHCLRGHLLSGANLRTERTGKRICRSCKRKDYDRQLLESEGR